MAVSFERAIRSPTNEVPTSLRTSLRWGQVAMAAGVTLLLVAGLAVLASGLAAAATPQLTPMVGSNHLSIYAGSSSSNSTGVSDKGVLALAASIAIAGGLIGTGMAQSGIGASGMGIIAERPEKFGQVLVFFVIPETLWILGFVLGILLLLQIL